MYCISFLCSTIQTAATKHGIYVSHPLWSCRNVLILLHPHRRLHLRLRHHHHGDRDHLRTIHHLRGVLSLRMMHRRRQSLQPAENSQRRAVRDLMQRREAVSAHVLCLHCCDHVYRVDLHVLLRTWQLGLVVDAGWVRSNRRVPCWVLK
jgi:hypothetical protein